jgi:flavorubredoxin
MNIAQIIKIIIIIIVILITVSGITIWKASQETITPLRTLNPQSSASKALVAYSPGISDFPQKTAEAFADGLAASNWHVDIVTASSQAPTDLTGYTLLVIGGPIYGGQPSKPVQDYMARLGDLEGLRVYTLLTSAGENPQAEEAMSSWVTAHGGVEAGMLVLHTMVPNTPVDGVSDPTQIAAKAAQSIPK